jgi:F-type H+-transporting ATPase subunit gamma
MSTALKEIKRRIGSTNRIEQVTSALQRVSAARLRRDRGVIACSQVYTRRLIRVLWSVVGSHPDSRHPLMQTRGRPRTVTLIVFGSDRGLCGGFNSDVMELVERFRAEHAGEALDCVAVGAVIDRRLRRAGLAPRRFHAQPDLTARDATVRAIADDAQARFLAGEAGAVYTIYSWFRAGLRHDPVIEQILPAPFAARDGGRPFVALEPSPAAVLDMLLPEFVYAAIDHAFLNSVGAENAARQRAMSRASRNARDMLRDLRRRYSRERQELVTREMLELVAGGGKS